MATFVTEGTTLASGNGASPEVFTTIPQLTSIDPVGFARTLIDVTNLSSSAREYKPALKDGAEINVEGQYDPSEATHVALRTDLNNGTTRNFQLTLQTSPNEVWTIAALVTAWNIGAPIDNIYPLRFTLKPTGDPTIS